MKRVDPKTKLLTATCSFNVSAQVALMNLVKDLGNGAITYDNIDQRLDGIKESLAGARSGIEAAKQAIRLQEIRQERDALNRVAAISKHGEDLVLKVEEAAKQQAKVWFKECEECKADPDPNGEGYFPFLRFQSVTFNDLRMDIGLYHAPFPDALSSVYNRTLQLEVERIIP